MLAFITINYGEKFFWEGRHLAAPFLLFFSANSKRQRRGFFQPRAEALGKENKNHEP